MRRTLKAVCCAGSLMLVLATSFSPSVSAVVNFSDLAGGLPWCDTTTPQTHTCGLGWLGSQAGALNCNTAPAMEETISINGRWAGWLEVASTDNCNNYTDNLGYVCENWANEPVNRDCWGHVWGQIW